ncbi:MAG: hypothetical protein A2Y15_03615 [Clostridiales bacterium GWF2_36_10]|nr:MAG: hypothetical protein A2Y15_03615 [Clostridiales bacterium GWF2_36_10]HAN20287.1 hypothetical protein [Clostridiales bacterium]
MKKILVIILTFLFLVPFSTACGEDPILESNESAETTSSDLNAIPVKDMEDREFKVLCWYFGYGSKSVLGFKGEVITVADEENASAVDTAKRTVLNKVQEDYNCKITGTVRGDDHIAFTNTIRNMVIADTKDYDMIFDAYGNLAPLVTENILYDLNTISNIDFTNSWWDQNARNDLSILNKLYFMCGDINTYDNDGTWCTLFNKTLQNKIGLGDIDFYQLVKDGEWTFDKFTEICKSGITKDTTGDGLLDEFDTWALGTETYNVYVHVVGAGEKIVRKDADDKPYFTIQEEATSNALSKILELYMDKNTVMVANAVPYTNKGYPNVWEATVHKAFIEGRELFYTCGLINVPSFRNMDEDFGILPIPMMVEGQTDYYHTVSIHNMSAVCIPKNVVNVEDVGLIMEALGKYSKEIVTPAYYDIQLKYRDARDDESGEMLDIIFASRSFDLGAAFNWGNTLSNYMVMDTNYTSRFESIMDAADLALETTLEQIQQE